MGWNLLQEDNQVPINCSVAWTSQMGVCIEHLSHFMCVHHNVASITWFFGTKLISPLKRFIARIGCHLLSTKPISLKDLTSFCERLAFSYTCQIKGTASKRLHIYILYLPHNNYVIICTKPKLMKLKRSDCELKGQTKIHRGRNINGIRLGNYPCGTIMITKFL
jgi:hypothetical protein